MADSETAVGSTKHTGISSPVRTGFARLGRPVFLARPGAGAGRAEPGGDRPGRGRVGAGLRHEHGLPVVLELPDALPDVGQRAMAAVLLRAGEVGPRVPAP